MRPLSLCSRVRAMAPLLGLAAAACAAPRSEEPTADLRGELVAYMVDFDDHSETHYALRDDSGQEHTLIFDPAPDLAAGTRLALWGRAQADGFKVSRF